MSELNSSRSDSDVMVGWLREAADEIEKAHAFLMVTTFRANTPTAPATRLLLVSPLWPVPTMAEPLVVEGQVVYWTKDEYDRCPELVNRLHNAILDLTDERDRYRAVLERIGNEEGSPYGPVVYMLARDTLNGL